MAKSNSFDPSREPTAPDAFESTLRNVFMGEEIYIEGARMNYVGKLVSVQSSGNGTALWFDPLVRVGDWGRQGPEPGSCMTMGNGKPAAIMLSSVEQFGLAIDGWLKRALGQ